MIYKPIQALRLSVLGFGAVRLPVIDGKDTQIDKKEAARIVVCPMERGMDYDDTA